MKRLTRFIDVAFKAFACISLMTMMTLVFYNAVLRYLFDASMPASEEIARFAFIWLVFLGAIVTERSKQHISVTMLTDRLRGMPAMIVRILREIVVFGTLGFLLYGSIQYTMLATFNTPATNTPFWIIAISLVIMAVCILAMKALEISLDIWASVKNKTSAGTHVGTSENKLRED